MSTAPRVAVVVTAFRPGRYVDECLASLAHQSYPDLDVTIVDGAGDDRELRDAVAMLLPGARIVDGRTYGGYGACANAGARMHPDAPFLVFLHDDAVLAHNAIASMVEVAYAANAGIVTPKLVAFDDPRSLQTVGWDLDPFFNPTARVEAGELDQGQLDEVVDVDAAPGAAMLVRRDLFDALGGFDDVFGLIGEDVDLSVRARLVGARVVTAPHARVRHRGVRMERLRRARRRRQVGTQVLEERVGMRDAERVWRRRRASRLMISSLYDGPIRLVVLVLFVLERVGELVWRALTGSPSAGFAGLRALMLSRGDRSALRRRRLVIKERARSYRAIATRTWTPGERLVAAGAQAGAVSAAEAAGPPRRLARWVPRSRAARWLLLLAMVIDLFAARGALTATSPGGSLLGGVSGLALLDAWIHARAVPAVLGAGVAPLGTAFVGLVSLVFGGDVGLTARFIALLSALAAPVALARLARREFDDVRSSALALLWSMGPALALGIARSSLSLIIASALAPVLVGATLAATQGQRLSPRRAKRAQRRLGLVAAVALAFSPQLVAVWLLVIAAEALWWLLAHDTYRLRRLGRALGTAGLMALGVNLPWLVALVLWHPGVGVIAHGVPGARVQSLGAHLFGGGYLAGPAPWLYVALAAIAIAAGLERSERARLAVARAVTGLVLSGLGALALLGGLGAHPMQPAYFDVFGGLLIVLAVPTGVGAVQAWLRRRRLGLWHLAAGVVAVATGVLGLGAALSAVIAPAEPIALPAANLALAGGFFARPVPTLWIEVGPGAPVGGEVVAANVTVAVTTGSQASFLGQFGPPVTEGYRRVVPSILDALSGHTVRLGTVLRRFGLGEVVVLNAAASPLSSAVTLGVERQVDLRQLLGTSSMTVAATTGVPSPIGSEPTPAWFAVGEVVAAGVLAWSVASVLGLEGLLARRPRRRVPPVTASRVEVLQ